MLVVFQTLKRHSGGNKECAQQIKETRQALKKIEMERFTDRKMLEDFAVFD